MIGNSIFRSPYWVMHPSKVCLSVPQMPDSSMRMRTQPGAGSGRGNSRSSYRPGSARVAAKTESRAMRASLSRIAYAHGPKVSCRLVDRVKDDHLPLPFEAVRLHIFVLEDRSRKGVELQGKFVNHRKPFLEFAAGDLPTGFALVFEGKSGGQAHPTLCALNKNERRHGGRVTGTALHDQPAPEVQAETDALLDIRKADAIMAPGVRRGLDRVFVDKPPRRVHAVDAEIHQWTAARQGRVQEPGGRNARNKEFAEGCVHHIDAAERSVPNELFQIQGGRLEILSVRGHQARIMLATSLYDCDRLRHGSRQRLFAQYVLSGLGRANRNRGMFSRRRGNVYSGNLWIGEACPVLVERVGKLCAKLGGQLCCFLLVAADQGNQFRLLAVSESGKNGVAGNVAEAHDRKTDLSPRCHVESASRVGRRPAQERYRASE